MQAKLAIVRVLIFEGLKFRIFEKKDFLWVIQFVVSIKQKQWQRMLLQMVLQLMLSSCVEYIL